MFPTTRDTTEIHLAEKGRQLGIGAVVMPRVLCRPLQLSPVHLANNPEGGGEAHAGGNDGQRVPTPHTQRKIF